MYIRLNIYIWKTKFSFHKQYLFGLLFSINAKKTHTGQSIIQTFLLPLRRNVSQTYKSSSWKKSLSQVCMSLIQLTLNVFLLHVITGRHYVLCKFIVTNNFGATAMLLRSLKQVYWISLHFISFISKVTWQCY